ncbi:MAG: undecaprenyl-diphosphate phosphatase [Sphingobacteriales bacterium]|jgi:undecaprenyl-diphosphatase|nr:undecaprenyl-diphosphate phosphatase [Sphingobacteriales bacterium]
MTRLEAVILAVVEGITEFLPVSSTGHMIIASSLMGIADDPFTKTFTVSIQFGAILSVVALYYKRFLQGLDFYWKLAAGFIPAAVFGFMLDDFIDSLLSNVFIVGITLVLGGIILLFIDRWFKSSGSESLDNLTYPLAFRIGMFQCLAMIPGVSRSAATIIGGLASGLNRKAAAEFSFFLAVPTMFAATLYKTYKFARQGVGVAPDQVEMLLIGNLVALAVAALAIRSFIGFLTKHGFRVFGWYRIVVGLLIIALVLGGYNLEVPD